MTTLDVSLLQSHKDALHELLFRDDQNERAAYVTFGVASTASTTWRPEPSYLLASHAIHEVPPSAIIESSPWRISWRTSDVIEKLKSADGLRLTLGIVHNHQAGDCTFSKVDDANEADLIRTMQNRNGSDTHLASLLLTPDRWSARLWVSPSERIDAHDHRVIGERFEISTQAPEAARLAPFLARQNLALGEPFGRQLGHLRIVIVGCGGTGSAVAALLARLGVGAICLVDADVVEESNLNRLHGASRSDAVVSRPKAEVVAQSIRDMGLGTNVVSHVGWVADRDIRDLLKSAHLVFGCTDDNSGRILLNRLAYAYQIPVIDLGLAIQLSNSSPPRVQAMDGRVTVLIPGNACLLCREVIDVRRASEESLKRKNPAEYEQLKAEAYVIGEQDPSPAVVTFTTELACVAVNEMIHRLQGYRGEGGSTASRTRLFHRMLDLRPGRTPDPECRVCGQPINWCRGDIEPFLGIVE